MYQCYQNSKCIDFHWKIIQRAIYSESRLQKMKRSDGKCILCKNEIETICHLLFECDKIAPLWKIYIILYIAYVSQIFL